MSDYYLNNVRSMALRGVITLNSGSQIVLNPADIYTYNIRESSGNEGFVLGASESSSYVLSVERSVLTGSGEKINGAEVHMQLGIEAENGDIKYDDFGVWYVTETEASEQSLTTTLRGYDGMALLFNNIFSDDGSVYPITIGRLMSTVVTMTGLTLKSADFPNSSVEIPTRPQWPRDNVTLRDVAGYCAACAGGFVRITRDGLVEVASYISSTEHAVLPSMYTKLSTSGGDRFSFNTLRVKTVDSETFVRYSLNDGLSDDVTNTLQISGNPLISDTIALSLKNSFNGFTSHALSITWLGNPYLLCGDKVLITDTNGEQREVVINQQTISFNGGLSIISASKLASSKSSISPSYTSGGSVMDENGNVRVNRITGFTGAVIDAMVGKFDRMIAGDITTDTLGAKFIEATKASIGHLDADSIDANVIKAGTVTAEKIASKTITAEQLKAGLITAESGIIADGAIGTAQIADGSITAAKVVELNADVIKAGTLSAERLVIVGEDGIIYRLNAASSGLTLTELEKDEYKNYINGTVIVAKSITAAQIAAQTITGNEILAGSITAKEIDVSDLFAAEATIQALNAMDITGNTYLKLMVTDAVDGVQVGGTNLIRNGGFYQGLEGWIKSEYDMTGDFRRMYVTGAGEGEYTPAEVPVLSLNAQNETGMFGATQVVTGLRKNTVYTVSGYVASHRCNVAAVEVRDTSFTHTALQKFWNVGWGGTNLGEYDHFAFTFNTGDYSDYRVFFCSRNYQENGYLWWAQLKLEEGDRATAWSPSPFDPADGVKTSYIEIADDHIDISSGGNVNIKAGGAMNVNSGTFDVTTGDFSMSLAKDDGTDVVMDIDDDGHTTFKAIHAGNVREAEYGYNYYDTASMGSLKAMADYLARTDARALEYQMSADEYGHVTLKEYNGYFKIYAAGHKLPKITVANSFTGTLWISTGYLSSEGGRYGDPWALTVSGGNVFTTNCWFAPGTTAGIMVEYGGIYRWLNWKDLSTETGYTLDPFIYASAGGIAHVIGGIPAGGRDIWHGFIHEGAYLSVHGGTGGSGSTVSTASAAGTLGYYGSSNGWHAGECFQGYSNAKGRAYGCLAFDLSGVGTIQTAKLTLHRKSGVGLNRKANVTVYGTTADRGSNPANGLTSAYVSAEGLIGWDGSATLDVTAAAQALKAGSIAQLVLYTGETGVYSGKAYSYHYAQFDSATLEVAYT